MKNTTQTTTPNASEKIQSAVEGSKNFFNENADEYTARLKKGYEYAKEKAEVATKEANEWVQKHPIMSLGVALGTGLLVGRLFVPTKTAHRRDKL